MSHGGDFNKWFTERVASLASLKHTETYNSTRIDELEAKIKKLEYILEHLKLKKTIELDSNYMYGDEIPVKKIKQRPKFKVSRKKTGLDLSKCPANREYHRYGICEVCGDRHN